jgi:hypothetical protein
LLTPALISLLLEFSPKFNIARLDSVRIRSHTGMKTLCCLISAFAIINEANDWVFNLYLLEKFNQGDFDRFHPTKESFLSQSTIFENSGY